MVPGFIRRGRRVGPHRLAAAPQRRRRSRFCSASSALGVVGVRRDRHAGACRSSLIARRPGR